jgi:hypothetical protein
MASVIAFPVDFAGCACFMMPHLSKATVTQTLTACRHRRSTLMAVSATSNQLCPANKTAVLQIQQLLIMSQCRFSKL